MHVFPNPPTKIVSDLYRSYNDKLENSPDRCLLYMIQISDTDFLRKHKCFCFSHFLFLSFSHCQIQLPERGDWKTLNHSLLQKANDIISSFALQQLPIPIWKHSLETEYPHIFLQLGRTFPSLVSENSRN